MGDTRSSLRGGRDPSGPHASSASRSIPHTRLGTLPLGQQQIVEIARALVRDVRVLMMDEPTSALSAAEVPVLFRAIRDLASHGVCIVYISHRLEELLRIADSVTVLRDGVVVGEAPTNDDRRPVAGGSDDRRNDDRCHARGRQADAARTLLSLRDIHVPAPCRQKRGGRCVVRRCRGRNRRALRVDGRRPHGAARGRARRSRRRHRTGAT